MAQRAERKIMVDAGVGDPDAPVGTEAWAQHLRLWIDSHIVHVHEEPEALGRTLDTLAANEAWKLLHRPDGSKFGSLEEYCYHRRPWGLGMSPAEVAKRVGFTATGQKFKALVSPDPKPEETTLTIEQAKALPVHEAATLLPMLSAPELDALAADIAEHGLAHPLVVFDGQILDGRNRLLACEKAGVEPRAVTLTECPSPAGYVLSVNLHRRHLDESQRAMVGAKATVLFKGEAKARQVASATKTNAIRRGETVPANLPEAKGEAREKAAALVNVSPRSVENAARVLRDGAPELVAAVEAGEVAVSAAVEVAKLPADEQRDVVTQGKAKDVAKESRSKKAKAPKAAPVAAPAPVSTQAQGYSSPEPPDACPGCNGRRFDYRPESTWDGKTISRWVCQTDGCGRVTKPSATIEAVAHKREGDPFVALADITKTLTDEQMWKLVDLARALARGEAA